MNYYGKCSRCNVVKKNYEIVPQPYDLLLCKMCYAQVQKDAKRDHEIEQIVEEIQIMIREMEEIENGWGSYDRRDVRDIRITSEKIRDKMYELNIKLPQ